MSRRERRLAVVAAAAAGLVLLYAATLPAQTYVRQLDDQIEALGDQVYNATCQAAMNDAVSQRYSELAGRHSTGWTEAEISDGLQRELDRLVSNESQPGGGRKTGRLLNITYRPEGQLTAYDGYREYQTTFTTQPTSISALAEFVRRIQESPQALRIDRLDLRRDNPLGRLIVAQIAVTRTVVDRTNDAGLVPSGNLARNAGFEDWDDTAKTYPEWSADGAALFPDSQFAVEGQYAARAVATQDSGAVYQVHKLIAGKKYRLSIMLATTGSAVFEVLDRQTGAPMPGGKKVVADGAMYEYTLDGFVVPGEPGAEVDLGIPHIALNGRNCIVYMDNLVLEAIE